MLRSVDSAFAYRFVLEAQVCVLFAGFPRRIIVVGHSAHVRFRTGTPTDMGADKVGAAKLAVAEVVELMQSNMERAVDRQEQLEYLGTRTGSDLAARGIRVIAKQ